MPAPVVQSALRAKMPHHRGLASQLGNLLRLRGVQLPENWVARFVVPVAWQISAPEGVPPFPRRGSVYSAEEGLQLNIWLMDNWAVYAEVNGRVRETADWIKRQGPEVEKRACGILAVHGGSDIWQILWNCWREFSQISYYRDGKEVSLSAEDKTPSEWVQALTGWVQERAIPFLQGLSLLKDPSLYVPLQTAADVNRQIKIWGDLESVGIRARDSDGNYGAALWKLYNISSWDKLPDGPKGAETKVSRLVAYGNITPWEGITRARKKKADEEDKSNKSAQRYREAFVRLLDSLAAAPADIIWSAPKLKAYLPPGYTLEPQEGKNAEVVVELQDQGLRFFFRPQVKGQGGRFQTVVPETRAAAWAAVSAVVQRFKETGNPP